MGLAVGNSTVTDVHFGQNFSIYLQFLERPVGVAVLYPEADPGENLTGALHQILGVVGVIGVVSKKVGFMG